MADVERGLIQKVVVYRLDRFSRSIADFGRLWEVLQAHSVEFLSINETFDTATPMGRAMLNIIIVFAQLERETAIAGEVGALLAQQARASTHPSREVPRRIVFRSLDFPGKKLVAAQLIERVDLQGDCAEVLWRV